MGVIGRLRSLVPWRPGMTRARRRFFRLVLGAEVYQLENLRDLSSLPEVGSSLIVAPIKLEGGSGGAVRVFALVSQ